MIEAIGVFVCDYLYGGELEGIVLLCSSTGNASRIVREECTRLVTDMGMKPHELPHERGLWVWEGEIVEHSEHTVGGVSTPRTEWRGTWRRPGAEEEMALVRGGW